jgi:Protein of unknown function (DUF3050)
MNDLPEHSGNQVFSTQCKRGRGDVRLVEPNCVKGAPHKNLRLYLERHTEVDSESHGPMALRMLEDLCGDDDNRWAEATNAAKNALEARLRMWDAIVDRIVNSRYQTDLSPRSPRSSPEKE